MPLRLLLICGFALLLTAPAHAVSMSGKKSDCLGGRGAPCGPIVRGLMNPVTGVFSSDGRSFYVGSLGNGGIVAMARDTASGRLAPVSGGAACIGFQLGCERSAHPMPSALAISADDRFVYAGGAGADEGLLAFTRDAATGALTPAGCLRGFRDACSYPGGSGDGYVNALEVTPDDRFVISAGDEGVGVVNRDPATGALTRGDCVVRSDDFTSYDEPSKGCRVDRKIGFPLELDLSPDGATVYVAAEDGGLSAYAVDRTTGALALADREPGGFYEVAVSPDGRNVYAVTEEFDVHAFTRDPASGALTRIRGKRGCISYTRGCTALKGVSSPEDIRIAPDGRRVYLAAAEGVSVLRRLPGGGLRQARGRAACNVMRDPLDLPRLARQCHHGPYELDGLTGFEIAPGGRHLYALESASNGTHGVGVVQLLRRN